jgi:hypothetical protein
LFHSSQGSDERRRNSWVHHNLDSGGWFWQTNGSAASDKVGVREALPLYSVSPSTYTSESPLLPLRAYVIRPSNLISLAVDCQYARRVRIDQYAPGEIITLGSDDWKVFPIYRKNTVKREGDLVTGEVGTTGTYGWALKYVPD